MDKQPIIRRALVAAGQVQGVGFRPFIYRLAHEEALSGSVGNTSEGVRMEVQGQPEAVARFARRLREELPPLARLTALEEHPLPPQPHENAFVIIPSQGQAGHSVLVSPDMGLCQDCLADMRDPANRRHAYAFTNCTNCGPRYTITRAIPYDRAVTSMACFPLCPDCAAEYQNPLDRRFHAQPIACPVCGPRLWLVSHAEALAGQSQPTAERQARALERAGERLLAGEIVAIKGLGGFQLACNARDAGAVRLLRQRKHRPHKALALMVGDMATARQLCHISPEQAALLDSPEKPIVLCPRRTAADDTTAGLAPEIAPDTATLGLMLPYTPLHAALFDWLACHAYQPPVMVMTSANPHGEPLCLGNREAVQRLAHLADAWLLHDRDILTRVDDSVLAVRPGQNQNAASAVEPFFYRRARGYVPRPVSLPPAMQEAPCVLGAGAELKATVCLARGNAAFVGQHVGDLENPATLNFYEESIQRLENLLEMRPTAIVCDLHPDFLSSRYAEERATREGIPLWRLQHHAAHAAAVLAENACFSPALALCLDGTGLGTDGSIWGGELLLLDLSVPRWQRLGRLSPFLLPGGEAAIREPWRIALALHRLCDTAPTAPRPWLPAQAQAEAAVRLMLERGLNCPATSSCGRLFDAVAAQLGLCTAISYEGQAAIRLETAAQPWLAAGLPRWEMPLRQRVTGEDNGAAGHGTTDAVAGQPLWELDSAALFHHVLQAQASGMEAGHTAAAFHLALAHGLAALAARAAARHGLTRVGLSGGVMQNAIMARLLPAALTAQGLEPLTHHELPPGDGGLALGQAVWGQCLYMRGQRGESLAT